MRGAFDVLSGRGQLNEDDLLDLEEALYESDFGVETTEEILDGIRESHRKDKELRGCDALALARATLERILDEYHENLYLDLSWVVLGSYVYKNLDKWVALINKHPNNFLIGSDSVGKYSGIPIELRKYQALLNALPDQMRSKVAYKNLNRILHEAKATRIKKGLGDGGITLPLDFSLSENFGLEALYKK